MRESRLIITVKEARKLLPRDNQKLTDDQVAKLITDYEQVARIAIKRYFVRNSVMVK